MRIGHFSSSVDQFFLKKDDPHSLCIFKIMDCEQVVRYMFKKPRFRIPLDRKHVEGFQTLLKSARQPFYQIILTLSGKLRCKISLLVRCQLLGLFVKTLTPNDKYSVGNTEKLSQPIQMHLPSKKEYFSQFVLAFLKFRSSFKNFEKKDDLHSLCVSELTDCAKIA